MSDLAAWFGVPFSTLFHQKRGFFSALTFQQKQEKGESTNRNVDSVTSGRVGMIFKIDLLDELSIQLDCAYLSDLHHLNDWQRTRLIRALEQTPSDAAELRE